MKKTILILAGISLLLIGTIYTIYRNSQNKNEEVVDIFKKEEKTEEKDKESKKEDTKISKVTVDIKGMVVNPGVYEVESNKRVNDVISLAGGLLEDADTSLINLAKIVTDEMTIIIYSKEEIQKRETKDEPLVCECPVIENNACLNEPTKEENILVNINTGSKEELMTISGIGESKANSIIAYRTEHGNFKTIEDIKNVSGIGEELFEKIKIYITV